MRISTNVIHISISAGFEGHDPMKQNRRAIVIKPGIVKPAFTNVSKSFSTLKHTYFKHDSDIHTFPLFERCNVRKSNRVNLPRLLLSESINKAINTMVSLLTPSSASINHLQ